MNNEKNIPEENKQEIVNDKKEDLTTENNNANKEEKTKKDTRTFSEKMEDGMDEVMGTVQDFFYGEGNHYNEDIPATIEKPSGIRQINKVQTRRNINKKLFGNKKFVKILLIIFAIPLGIYLLTYLISLFIL